MIDNGLMRPVWALILLAATAHAELVGKRPFPDGRDRSAADAGMVLPDGQIPEGPSGVMPPAPVTLRAAAQFVQLQRGQQGRGLPALFWVPPGLSFADPMARLITTEGVGTYDSALAVLVLLEAGEGQAAAEILDIYAGGTNAPGSMSPMTLRAYPALVNNSAFKPFDPEVYYLFNFTNVHGEWLRWKDGWKFWATHTGPNAWMVLAAVRGGRLDLAEALAQAMQRLQDEKTGGAVRYGPKGVWHAEDQTPPFETLNTENNLSAYAAFRLLAQATGKKSYSDSADRILTWLTSVYRADSATFAVGQVWRKGHWQVDDHLATDSGGTWAISALGASAIEERFGDGSAWRMWQTLRRRCGRTADFRPPGPDDTLAGFDFTDQYPDEGLISPEWTAGAIFAVDELLRLPALTVEARRSLERDRRSMAEYLRGHAKAYAYGPGHGGRRQGATGFGWSSPPEAVSALASVYVALALNGAADPLGQWRHPDPHRSGR